MMVEPIGQCLSDYRIDQWLGGELAPDASAALEAHAARCATCTARVEALTASRDHFTAAPMPRALAEALAPHAAPRPAGARPQLAVVSGGRDPRANHDAHGAGPAAAPAPPAVRAPARRRLALAAAPALAAAAAVLLWLRAPEPAPTAGNTGDTGTQPVISAERIKGRAHMTVFVVRDGAARAAGPGEIVHPGDTLQITYTAGEPVHLAVLSRDGAGVGSVYFDDQGRAAALAPGQDVALPHSIVLDDTLGRESLYGLFCTRAVDLAPLRQSLEAATFTAPAGCRVEELVIEKRAP
jgi:hypothetical protein